MYEGLLEPCCHTEWNRTQTYTLHRQNQLDCTFTLLCYLFTWNAFSQAAEVDPLLSQYNEAITTVKLWRLDTTTPSGYLYQESVYRSGCHQTYDKWWHLTDDKYWSTNNHWPTTLCSLILTDQSTLLYWTADWPIDTDLHTYLLVQSAIVLDNRLTNRHWLIHIPPSPVIVLDNRLTNRHWLTHIPPCPVSHCTGQ